MTDYHGYELSPDVARLNADKLTPLGTPGKRAVDVTPDRPKVTEYQMQASLFDWRDKYVGQVPELRWLFAVPNGQYRPGQRPEPGLTAGVPDVCLAVERMCWAAFWIELKVGKNTTSSEQDAWLDHLHRHGHKTAVVYDDWRLAANLLLRYLVRDDLLLGIE